MNSDVILSCENLSKTYHDGTLEVSVLASIACEIHRGEKLAIVGPSGVGKSTLLHLLGGLQRPSSGQVNLFGRALWELSETERSRLRNQALGFVYQFHHLLPEFSALENVMMPLLVAKQGIREATDVARDMLCQVNLEHRLQHKPSELSGGERQRVAIARALVMKPKCVLADEPTGNLDEETANQVFELFLSLSERHQTAFVIVTHNMQLAGKMQRILHLSHEGLADG